MSNRNTQNKGNWFKINRKLFKNNLWNSEPFTKGQAWIDLIGNTNHKDGSFNVRGVIVEVKRGQIGWSELTMAERWKWSRNKVRRFLATLECQDQIEKILPKTIQQTIQQNPKNGTKIGMKTKQQKNRKITTVIAIKNYDKFQKSTTNDTTDDTTEPKKRYTNKKVKKEKNIIGEQSSHELQSNTKPMTYEEPSIDIDTGELIQGTKQDVRRVKDKEAIYQLFSNTKQPWMFHKQQREAALRLFDLKGLEQVKRALAFMKENSSDKFCPQAPTPFKLEEKWDALLAYRNRV